MKRAIDLCVKVAMATLGTYGFTKIYFYTKAEVTLLYLLLFLFICKVDEIIEGDTI